PPADGPPDEAAPDGPPADDAPDTPPAEPPADRGSSDPPANDGRGDPPAYGPPADACPGGDDCSPSPWDTIPPSGDVDAPPDGDGDLKDVAIELPSWEGADEDDAAELASPDWPALPTRLPAHSASHRPAGSVQTGLVRSGSVRPPVGLL